MFGTWTMWTGACDGYVNVKRKLIADNATADIDADIARARRQLELLSEYRTRLIADVVTGKLDVSEAAAQLPDESFDGDPEWEGGPLANDLHEELYDAGDSVGLSHTKAWFSRKKSVQVELEQTYPRLGAIYSLCSVYYPNIR